RTVGIAGGAHVVTLVGFRDDANLPGGGEWIYKNSWGSEQGDGGYNTVSYNDAGLMHNDLVAMTGGAYCAAPMASATWTGGAGTWAAGNSTKWNGYAWENQETMATFGGTGGAVTISGPAIAHGLTINSGSTGYTFTGGSMTVTAGGITANESVTINSPLTVGAPQTWNVASGKTLTTGDVHTVISNLTITGSGNTTINGSLDGGGVLNIYGGAAAGNITKTGTGTLKIAGAAADYDGNMAASTGTVNFAPGTGVTSKFSGVISGGATIQKTGNGTTIFAADNTYTSTTTISAGALQADSGTGLPGNRFLSLAGGVLQSNSAVTFTRSLGTSGSAFQWTTSGGGFAGGEGPMTVRVNNGTGTLSWGTSGNVIKGILKFGSTTAKNWVEMQNGINLGSTTRTVWVEDNPETAADYAVISGNITGTGGLTKTGAGILRINGDNTYSGRTTISDGALQANDANGLPSASFLSLNGAVLQSNGGSPVTFTRSLGTSGNTFQWTSNGGGFAAGAAAMTVRVNNGTGTLSWGTTGNVIKGRLRLGAVTSANVVDFQNGINLNGGTRTIQVYDNPSSSADYALVSGVISNSTGTGNLIKTDAGRLMLSATNTYNGATTISGGELQADFGVGVPSTSFLTLDGGVLQSNSTRTFTRSLGASGSTFRWTANGGGFSAGAGAMTVNVGNGTALTWGSTVGTHLVGTLKLSSPTAGNVTTFQNSINLGGASRTIHVDDNPDTSADYAVLSGVLSGTGSLTKTGSGTVYLSGGSGNTYSGDTTVWAGGLRLDKSSGVAIPGNLNLMSGGSDNNSVYLQRSNQIASSGSITFAGTPTTYSQLILLGHSQTVAGISCSMGNGVIENTKDESGISTNGTLTLNNAADNYFDGYLRDRASGSSTGKLALVKNGAGTLTLVGENISYSGGTTVNAGKLVLRDASSMAGNIALNGVTLDFDNSGAEVNYGGVLSGTGTVNKLGFHTLTLSGASGNTWTGTTNVTNGALYLDKSSGVALGGDLNMVGTLPIYVYLNHDEQIANSGVVTLGNSESAYSRLHLQGHTETVAGISDTTGRGVIKCGNLIVNNSANYSYNGYLCDDDGITCSLVKQGSGTLTLAGENIYYTAGTTISGGKLVLQDTTNSSFRAANITNNATLEFNTAAEDVNFSGVISGSGALNKIGTDTLTLSGGTGNSYSGATTVSGGTVVLDKSSGSAISGNLNMTATSNIYVNLNRNEQIANSAVVTFSNTGSYYSRLNLQGHTETVAGISDTTGRGVIKRGNLIVNNSSNYSYNGYLCDDEGVACSLVKQGSGTLTLSGNKIQYTAGTTVSGGKLVLQNTTDSGFLATNVTNNATLEFNTTTANLAFNGTISGTGALRKIGNYKLTLNSASNSYSGVTTVAGGVLSASSTAVPGAITVDSGGAFAPGAVIGSATTGAAAWNAGGKYLFEINDADGTAGTNWDKWNITGNLSIASSPFTIAVTTLAGATAGEMADFNNTSSYSWLLAETTGTISGFGNLDLDASGFQNDLAENGYLYLSQSGTYKMLYLNYSPTGREERSVGFVPGDADQNGVVDGDDALILANYWGVANASWSMGDFNGDDVVNAADASLLAAHWGQTMVGESQPVPEPGIFAGLAVLAVAGLLRRRWRV
ncbi:MAG: autotransporter-associated beta strand repeat-containing protein, partial [Pirellulales bacterium]|nr:autotransporter-associated beta strand repeat-containing protein [Pirellulales bacterium]